MPGLLLDSFTLHGSGAVTQFTYDLAAEAVDSGVPDDMTDRSGGDAVYSVVSDSDAPSGKAIRIDDVSSGTIGMATWDSVGGGHADVEMLALVKPQFDDPANENGGGLCLRADTVDQAYYCFQNDDGQWRIAQVGPTTTFDNMGSFGAGATNTSGGAIGVRVRINGTNWEYRTWLPAVPGNNFTDDEPGTWDASGTDSDLTSGYLGIGLRQAGTLHTDFLYLSAGISGATAPNP